MTVDASVAVSSGPTVPAGPTIATLGERAIVARILARLAMPSWVLVGPGDDAAVIEPGRGTVDVLTTDILVEHVHFDRRFCPLDAIGHKALAVNLSDLAAMGATPRAALLSLVLPDDLTVAGLDALLDGLLGLAARSRITVIGGNIARAAAPPGALTSGPLIVDVTATGTVGRRRILTRSGARAGDDVYVTGTLGAGALGLRSLRDGLDAPRDPRLAGCEARYLRPEPRGRAGMLLGRNRAASACMDLSDGLGDAVRQIAEASGVGISIDAGSLPMDPAVREWHAAVHRARPQGRQREQERVLRRNSARHPRATRGGAPCAFD